MGLKTHIRNYKVIDAIIDIGFDGVIAGINVNVPCILFFLAAYLYVKSIHLNLNEIIFFFPMNYDICFGHV